MSELVNQSDEIIIVDEKTEVIDGIKYIVLVDNTGSKWINLEPIGTQCGYKDPSNAINKLYNRNKDAFTNKTIKRQTVGIRRPRLFFNNEGITLAKLLSRKFRKQPERLEALAKFLSQLDEGTLRVIHRDNAELLKQQMSDYRQLLEINHQILLELKEMRKERQQLQQIPATVDVFQKEVIVLKEKVEEYDELRDYLPLTGKQKAIIRYIYGELIEKRYEGDFPLFWDDWEAQFGVRGYKNLPRDKFKEAIYYLFCLDQEITKRRYKEWLSQLQPKEQEKELIEVYEKITQSKFQTRINPDYQLYA